MAIDYEGMDLRDAARLMVLPTLGRSRVKVEVVARRLNIAPSTLYNILDGYKPLEAVHVPALTQATGDRLLVEAVSYQSGGLFIPFLIPRSSAETAVVKALCRVIRESSDVADRVESILDPSSPGGEETTPDELEGLDKEILELINALTELRSIVAAQGGSHG